MQHAAALLLYSGLALLVVREADSTRGLLECSRSEDCSPTCHPEIWDRQLCTFYRELEEWRTAVLECGLAVGPMVVRDTSLPAEQQWREAREYWAELRAIWEESLSSESTSGSIGVTASPSSDNLELWQSDTNTWLEQLQDWKVEVFEEAGISLPVQGVESATPTAQWMTYIADWSSSVSVYNATFFGQCPTT